MDRNCLGCISWRRTYPCNICEHGYCDYQFNCFECMLNDEDDDSDNDAVVLGIYTAFDNGLSGREIIDVPFNGGKIHDFYLKIYRLAYQPQLYQLVDTLNEERLNNVLRSFHDDEKSLLTCVIDDLLNLVDGCIELGAYDALNGIGMRDRTSYNFTSNLLFNMYEHMYKTFVYTGTKSAVY